MCMKRVREKGGRQRDRLSSGGEGSNDTNSGDNAQGDIRRDSHGCRRRGTDV